MKIIRLRSSTAWEISPSLRPTSVPASAALMMATLQASLRGEATQRSKILPLLANINRLVYEASSANRCATFFYGQYDPTMRIV